MSQSKYVLLALALASIVGCGSGSDSSDSGDPRVILNGYPVPMISNGFPSSNFLLTLAATIVPPTVSGNLLAADDVFVSGTNAYVSYNTTVAARLGAIDQISFLVPALPVRTASTSFTDSTVNGVYVSSGNVYTVGATTTLPTSGWPAFINKLTVSGSAFSAQPTPTSLLNTYAGTGVTSWNGSIYALSGANGASTSSGLSILNPSTLAPITTANNASYISIGDARGLSYYPGSTVTDLFVIAGSGNLYDINYIAGTTAGSGSHIVQTIAVGGNATAESKSTVQVGKTMVAVSKSEAGAAIVCQADQKILATLPAVTVSGLAANLTVTNAVTVGPGLLFAADGEAGVYVYTITNSAPTTSVCNNVTLTQVGIINTGSTTYSANNVRYVGGTLFIATGLGGFEAVTVTVLSPILNANTDFM